MTAVRVLGKTSSINVRKVLWACEELGVACEREHSDTGLRPEDAADIRRHNPNGLVPILIEGDFVLWESNTILRYLANSRGDGSLLPREPKPRAVVEQWMDWQATEFNNSWRYSFMALVRKSPAHTDPAATAASVSAWNHHVQIVEERLASTGGHIAGPDFSLADIPIGLSINRWLLAPIATRPRFDCVSAYYAKLSERPAFLRHGRNGIA